MTAPRPSTSRPRSRAAGSVLAVGIGVLAMIGAGTAVQAVRDAGSATSPAAAALAASTARTSWGTVRVEQSEVVDGLSGKALGGMSHGVQNLVSAGQAQIAVTVTLHNTSGHVVHYDADQFRLRTGRTAPTGAPTAPMGTSLNPGDLLAGGSVEGAVHFVTPADGSRMWVQLDDGGHPVLLAIGAASAPTSAPDEGGPTPPAHDDH